MSREMKHSGIEWIGEIPKEWEVIRGKYLFNVLNGYAFDSGLFTNDIIYTPLIRIRDISNYETEAFYMGEYSLDYVVKKGDVLVGMDGDFNVAKWKGGDAILNQRVCKLHSFTDNYLPQYAYYILPMLLKGKNDVTYATTVKHLSSNDIQNFPYLVPPFSEQQKIANYLDKVCGEVDEMIALQEKMIEELKAYKQSVITEAVTKGLNPNAPMHDSGIDWIGEIPEHWKLGKIGRLFSVKAGGDASIEDYSDEQNSEFCYPVFTNTLNKDDVYAYTRKPKFGGETITVTGRGAIGHAIYRNMEYDAIIRLLVLIPKSQYDCRYYAYFIDMVIVFFTNSAAIGQLSANQILPYDVCVPPLSEQQSIASYLDEKCSEIDSLIAIKQAKIEELKEYKKSVIYEYVTGKKEIA